MTKSSPLQTAPKPAATEYVARKLAHVPSWQHVRWQTAENDNQRGERARKRVSR